MTESLRRWYHLSVWIGLLLTARPAAASLWENPSFRGMVQEAKLIGLAEVVEPGQMNSRVRVVETFKGEAPPIDVVVTGYNNGCSPKDERERQRFRSRERYLLFLQPTPARSAASDDRSPAVAADCSGEAVIPKAWQSLPRYSVPNPSMGDYRIEQDSVVGDWRFCSNCSERLAVPTATVFPVLRAMTGLEEPLLVSAGRSIIGMELTSELVEQSRIDEQARTKLAWLLEGQGVFGDQSARPALFAAMACEQPDVRVAAVRALPSLGTSQEVLQLLNGLLYAHSSGYANALQVEATRSLCALDPTGRTATALLAAAVGTSDPSDSVRRDVMDPVVDEWVSARRLMVTALTRYRATQAEPALLSLLHRNDNQPGTLDALMNHFTVFRSVSARLELLRLYAATPESQLSRFNRYFVDDGDPAALDVVFERMLRPKTTARETRKLFKYYALHRPDGDPRLEAAVARYLRERLDDNEMVELVPMALVIRNEAVIQQLLRLDPAWLSDSSEKTQERVARALTLKRAPPIDPELRRRAWIQLLSDDRWSGHATPYLLREIACSTPVELRQNLAYQLDQQMLPALVQQMSLAFSFDSLDTSTSRAVPEFNCAVTALPASTRAAATVSNLPTHALARRSGCGAGCAVSASDRRSAMLGWLVILLGIMRSRKRTRFDI